MEILHNQELLNAMMIASESAPPLYKPGPYWEKKAARTVRELTRYGMSDFRSGRNSVAGSFGDADQIDAVNNYCGVKYGLFKILRNLFPFSKLMDSQIGIARAHTQRIIQLESWILNNSDRVVYLLGRYKLTEGELLGGVERASCVHGNVHSHHAVHMLDLLDRMLAGVDIEEDSSYMEIGGGFGMNVCLMANNFPSIKKYLYIDIAPNLYIGTQFLRANFPRAVKDFSLYNHCESIKFTETDELEIICLLPHQVENFGSTVDVFHNANSFVEMPRAVVKNYGSQIRRILNGNGKVLLSSYGGFDLGSTFNPDELLDLLSVCAESYEHDLILSNGKPQKFYTASYVNSDN